ncbi:MAG: hypothetical protein HY650_16470 [Acidobacteria bacterium]|nr:hypothetical protein [Acidobacteriota bacterium]
MRIWNLHRKLNLHLLASKLGDLYKPLVMTNRVVFRINGREVRPTPVPVAARSIVIQIEIKSFDASLRSALVERDGRQFLVINRSFPAYKLAGGGLAYLLETACLEWARRESTGQESAVELIDRAVKLLGESSHIALTGRRHALRMPSVLLS